MRGVQVPTTPPKAPAPPPPSSSSLPGRAAGLPPSPPEEEKQTFTERMESPSPMITQKPVPMKREIDISGKKHKKEKKMKPSSKKKSAPCEIVSREKQRKKGKELGEISDFEIEEEASDELYDYAADEGKVSDRSILAEPTTILQKKLIRKATVFYKKRMNPMKLNKMTVFLSTSEIFEELKLEFEKIARAATGKALEIEEDESIVRIEPSFPGCVCVPTVGYLDAKKEYDHLNFIVSPLSTGEIPEAKVNIYYKDKLIDTIATPAKVVNTNIAKISAVVTLIIPLIGTIFDEFFSQLFGDILPFYSSIGGLEGILTILTTFMLIISGISYYLRKPKDAKPAESKSLSEIVSSISE